MNDNLAITLSYGAALIHIIAFFLYGRGIIRNQARPNAATMTIWAFGSFITLYSYAFVAQDWYKETVAVVDSIGCLAIFVISTLKGKFKFRELTSIDVLILLVDILAIIIWQQFGGRVAYYVLQISALLSIVPMCRQVWNDVKVEDSFVWFLWTSAYFISGVVVVIRWNGFDDILYQINYTLMHLAVALVCVIKARKLKYEVATIG